MKPVVFYDCEVCGRRHEDPNRAQKCEVAHKPVGATEITASFKVSGGLTARYPMLLYLATDEGRQLTYRLESQNTYVDLNKE